MTAKAGASFTVTIGGANLTGATGVLFIDLSSLPGNGKSHGKGVEDNHADTAFTVTNVQVNAAGTQLTAAVAINAGAKTGPRLVKVMTSNGETSGTVSSTNTFTVIP